MQAAPVAIKHIRSMLCLKKTYKNIINSITFNSINQPQNITKGTHFISTADIFITHSLTHNKSKRIFMPLIFLMVDGALRVH